MEIENKRRKWKGLYDMPVLQEIRNKILNNFNNKLQFVEETHQYFLDGIEYECVSNITHRYEAFDRDKQLNICAAKAKKNPNYKYYGMSKKEISELWDKASSTACDAGTETHEFGESMFYYMIGEDEKILPSAKNKFKNGKPCPSTPKEEQVVKFWNDLPEYLIPVLAETKIFNKIGTPYAGTFDILFYYYKEDDLENQGLVIFDYKTNEKLKSNFNTKMLYPFQDMIDENLSHYTLQLNLYQIPLEEIGLKVKARRLIWLQEDKYDIIKLKDVRDKLKRDLNFHLGEIKPKNKKVLI